MYFLSMRNFSLYRGIAYCLQWRNAGSNLDGLANGEENNKKADAHCQQYHAQIKQRMKSFRPQNCRYGRAEKGADDTSDYSQQTALFFHHSFDLFLGCTNGAKLPITLNFIVDGNTENTLNHDAATDQHQYSDNAHQRNSVQFKPFVKAEILGVCSGNGKPGIVCDLAAEGMHGIFVQVLVIDEMHIGAVSGWVKAGPVLQHRFGNQHAIGIRFFFPETAQDTRNHVFPLKALCVQLDGAANFGIRSELRKEIIADGNLVCGFGQPSFLQAHLVAEHIKRFTVAVHKRKRIAFGVGFRAYHVVFPNAGKFRNIMQLCHNFFRRFGKNDFPGVGHLIFQNLRHGNTHCAGKADQKCRQSNRDYCHQIAPLFALHISLCQFLYNGGSIIFKRPCHSVHPPYPTIFPSSIRTIRSARRAISLLWVIITTVW